MGKQTFVKTQISNTMRVEFMAAIADEYAGATDFFQRRIKEKCKMERQAPQTPPNEPERGYTCLNVTVTPEQRAALLAQCEKEGKTMGTWMRDEIKSYLEEKQKEKKQ